MTDATPAASNVPATAPCAGGSCCTMPCECPCAARICKLEKSVRRIRIGLFVALGVLIFVIGAAIGSGSAKHDMMEHMRMMDERRAAGPQGPAPMMNQGPGGPPMGQRPGPQGPDGPGPDRRPDRRR